VFLSCAHAAVGGTYNNPQQWRLDRRARESASYVKCSSHFRKSPELANPLESACKKITFASVKSATRLSAYAIARSMVDHCFPVLEQLGDSSKLELITFRKTHPKFFDRIPCRYVSFLLLRRIVWPHFGSGWISFISVKKTPAWVSK